MGEWRVPNPVERLGRGIVDAARATDGGARGECMKHYKYIEIVKYATGQLGEVRLMIRHLDNCQPCRTVCENVKENMKKFFSAAVVVLLGLL